MKLPIWWWARRKRDRACLDPAIIDNLLLLKEMLSGVAIIGGTGSGKTSGPGRVIALNALEHPSRPGFHVACAVNSEGERFKGYCASAGRSGDFVRIAPGSGHRFDFLTYSLQGPFGSIEATAQLFDMLVSVNDSQKSGGGENPFWPIYQQKITRMAIAAVWYGKGSCSVSDLYDFMISVPSTPTEADSTKWRTNSFCGQCLTAGLEAGKTAIQDFALASMFWLKEFPGTEAKTRSIGISMFLNVLTKFLIGPIAELVRGPSNITPDDIIDGGQVHVTDMPILQYGSPARDFQIIYKVSTQRACERRDITKRPRTVIGWFDEFQQFLVPEFDTMFQATARQSGYSSVILTQNIATVVSLHGGGEAARQRFLGLLGNHMTKIFCANSDEETNQFASTLLGKSLQFWPSGGGGNTEPFSVVDDYLGKRQGSPGFSTHYHPDVPPEAFTTLRKGGAANGLEVDTYFTQSGRIFPNGKTWVKVPFAQG